MRQIKKLRDFNMAHLIYYIVASYLVYVVFDDDDKWKLSDWIIFIFAPISLPCGTLVMLLSKISRFVRLRYNELKSKNR